MKRISARTKLIAILGDPVEHSRSPAMHNAAFRALGLDFVYVAFHVRRAELRRAIGGLRALGIAGLNVTVPHKERILPLLDRVSPTARAIGAVNTVYRRGSSLCGENTDAEGFLVDLRAHRFDPHGKTAVVLGAGGSARAVAWALARAGARRLLILNRTVERAHSLRRKLGNRRRLRVQTGPLEAALYQDVIGGADLIVNCTSLGLDGRSLPEVAFRQTPKGCVFYDLVYRNAPTPFVVAARRAGRRTVDGRGMLVRQAVLAFRLWTGRRPDVALMAAALC